MSDPAPEPEGPYQPPPDDRVPPQRRAFAPLRIPAYRWYLAGLLLITLGIQVQAAALFWQVPRLAGLTLSLGSIGLVGLAEALPAIAMALYAGHIADRHDRRVIALIAGMALLGCSLAFLGCARLEQSAWLQWPLYGIVAVSGLARSFLGPARTALGAELVPRELFAPSISLRSATWQFGLVCGPALGGALIALAHGRVELAYTVDAALMVAGIACLAAVRRTPPPRPPRDEPLLTSLRGGVAFVWREKTMLAAMSLDLFAVLFGGAMALLEPFASRVLLVGATEYGWLRAAPSLGAVAMWITLAFLSPPRRAGPTMLWSVAAFGGCWIGFGLSSSLAVSLALLVASGACDYISVVVRQTLVQTRTPQQLLGRVSAVNAMFIGSSNEIGAFESGLAAQWLGLQRSVVAGGAITVAIVGAIAASSPGLRRLSRLDR
jgi:MFS family permease